MEWVRIHDRLPPQDKTPFLGYDPEAEKNGRIYVLIYQPEIKYEGELKSCSREACYQEASGEGYFTWKPSHWMPLPKPPEESIMVFERTGANQNIDPDYIEMCRGISEDLLEEKKV